MDTGVAGDATGVTRADAVAGRETVGDGRRCRSGYGASWVGLKVQSDGWLAQKLVTMGFLVVTVVDVPFVVVVVVPELEDPPEKPPPPELPPLLPPWTSAKIHDVAPDTFTVAADDDRSTVPLGLFALPTE